MVTKTASKDPSELFEAERNPVKALVDDFITSTAEVTTLVNLQLIPKLMRLPKFIRQGGFSCQKFPVKSYARNQWNLYFADSNNSIVSLNTSYILSNFSQLNQLNLSALIKAGISRLRSERFFNVNLK